MADPRKKRFFFHYNKPESKRTGKAKVSVHAGKACMIFDAAHFKVEVETEGKVRTKQPHFVMQGWYSKITSNGAGVVTIS